LRERRDDIPLLVDHLVHRAAAQCGKSVAGVSVAGLAALRAYDWPGNVRELAHVLERSVALARGSVLDVEDLPAVLHGGSTPPVADLVGDLPTLEQLKHRYIQHVVELHGGNVSRAAAVLGVERRSLYRMLRRYGIAHRVTEE
jgi:DNA-binding NtrC family response regulator